MKKNPSNIEENRNKREEKEKVNLIHYPLLLTHTHVRVLYVRTAQHRTQLHNTQNNRKYCKIRRLNFLPNRRYIVLNTIRNILK